MKRRPLARTWNAQLKVKDGHRAGLSHGRAYLDDAGCTECVDGIAEARLLLRGR